MFLLLAISTVIGGWTLSAVVRGAEHSLLDLPNGGQILYGSFLSVVPLVAVCARLLRIGVRQAFDAAGVSAPLGLAIGRIGCFLGGCCHGTTTNVPWAVTYPKVVNTDGAIIGSPAYMLHLQEGLIAASASRSLPVHPVQIYESSVMIGLFAVLFYVWRRGRFSGRIAPLFILSYCVVRFALEFVRVQEMVLWGWALAQVLSAGIGAAATIWLILGRKANAGHKEGGSEEPASTAQRGVAAGSNL